MRKSPGNKFVGFVTVNGSDNLLDGKLNYFGKVNKVQELIKEA